MAQNWEGAKSEAVVISCIFFSFFKQHFYLLHPNVVFLFYLFVVVGYIFYHGFPAFSLTTRVSNILNLCSINNCKAYLDWHGLTHSQAYFFLYKKEKKSQVCTALGVKKKLSSS